MGTIDSEYYRARLSNADFKRLSDCIYNGYGIKMPEEKKVMLQSRLQKRLRAMKIKSFTEYCDLVLDSDDTSELINMIDVVSTNKTSFFRESVHFDFMQESVLPEFYDKNTYGSLNVWSSACSSGEEAYSVAMTIEEFKRNQNLIDYTILGTDISTEILQKAVNAIYLESRASDIPMELRRNYLLRSKDKENPKVRIIRDLRKKVRFQRLNLMKSNYPVGQKFDIIFCRNVLIYFDQPTQEKVINKLCSRLKTNGYFFLGHSESVTGMDVPLKLIKPTIFKKI